MIYLQSSISTVYIDNPHVQYPNWLALGEAGWFTMYEGNLYGVYHNRVIRAWTPAPGTTCFNRGGAHWTQFWRKHDVTIEEPLEDLPLYLITHMVL